MKKKLIVSLISIALLVGLLSGCVTTQQDDDDNGDEPEPTNNAPIAAFTYEIDGLIVAFIDASIDADDDDLTYLWDFGDGETSTAQSPEHTYTTNDKRYDVTLTVTDPDGESDSETQTISIGTPNNPPEASFTVDVDDATKTATFNVTASDLDEDNLTYSWEFGDGEISAVENPEHTYAENGTYTVNLTVSDGKDDTIVTEDIGIGNVAPLIDFVAINETGLMLFLQDISTDGDGEIVLREWDFGDGTTDSLEAVYITHTYTAPGTYTITLTITDDDGATASLSKEVIIELLT